MAPSIMFSIRSLCLTLLAFSARLQAQYVDPNDDPFYAVPSDVGSHPVGYVFKSRQVTTPQETTNVKAAYQILYRTTNQQGGATATVATVWVPNTPRSPPKILLYGVAEDSLNIDCAGSWGFVNSSSQLNGAEKNIQAPIVVPFATGKGYYVVSPDADGPTSAWLVGNIEGKASLDAIKATISRFGLARPAAALFGYSGGARTAVWAATVAATGYAPEFDVVGASFGGTPVDLASAYNTLDNTGQSVLAAGAIFGLGNGYPSLNSTLTSKLTPTGLQVSTSLRRRNNCIPSSSNNDGVPQNVDSLFYQPPLTIPELNTVLNGESLLSNVNPSAVPVPTFPRLEYHGNNDKTVPYQPESDYVSQQCNSGKGAKIWFSTFYGFDHGPTAIAGFLGALQFVSSALDGVNLTPPSCGATTAPMPAPGSSDAVKLLGQSLSNTFCQLCSCC